MKNNKKNRSIRKVVFICIAMSMFQLISYASSPPRSFEKLKEPTSYELSMSEETLETKKPEGIKAIDCIEEVKGIITENLVLEEPVLEEPTVEEFAAEEPVEKGFTYNTSIPMPKEHQEYLYNKCKERGLDYLKTLAIISLESNFNNSTVSGTNDYGYMQINKANHNHLSKTLGTGNNPKDPYVNINWGTYMLEDLYSYWRNQGISEELSAGNVFTPLDKYVMSSYNKGIAGFKRYGMAVRYINLTTVRYHDILKLQ